MKTIEKRLLDYWMAANKAEKVLTEPLTTCFHPGADPEREQVVGDGLAPLLTQHGETREEIPLSPANEITMDRCAKLAVVARSANAINAVAASRTDQSSGRALSKAETA